MDTQPSGARLIITWSPYCQAIRRMSAFGIVIPQVFPRWPIRTTYSRGGSGGRDDFGELVLGCRIFPPFAMRPHVLTVYTVLMKKTTPDADRFIVVFRTARKNRAYLFLVAELARFGPVGAVIRDRGPHLTMACDRDIAQRVEGWQRLNPDIADVVEVHALELIVAPDLNAP